MRTFRAAALLCGLPLWLAAAAPDPVIRVTTRLVQVNVVARDKHGAPEADLRKSDFKLKDNGKARELSFFSLERTRSSGEATAGPDAAAHVFSNRSTQVPTGATIILFDALNTLPADQVYARDQLVRFLSRMRPEEHIALYRLGRSLDILQEFSSDSSDLIAAARHAMEASAEAVDRTPVPIKTGKMKIDALMNAANQVFSDFQEVQGTQLTFDALRQIARHVASVPGRKNLVWISGGFSERIGDDPDLGDGRQRLSTSFFPDSDRLMRVLNDADLAVYPVDARGLIARESAQTQEVHGPADLSGGADRYGDSLAIVAEQTGGVAYRNRNDLDKAIGQALRDAQTTYTLAFYVPTDQLDGKYHQLSLKVERPGVRLRYRSAYLAAAAESKRPVSMHEAAYAPVGVSEIGLKLSLEPAGGLGYVASLVVDPHDVSMVEKDGTWNGQLELLVLTGNGASGHYDRDTAKLDLHLPREAFEKMAQVGLTVRHTVHFAPGADELKMALRDTASGAVGSLSLHVAPQERR